MLLHFHIATFPSSTAIKTSREQRNSTTHLALHQCLEEKKTGNFKNTSKFPLTNRLFFSENVLGQRSTVVGATQQTMATHTTADQRRSLTCNHGDNSQTI